MDAPKKDDLADSLFQALAHKYVKGTEKKVKADQALKRKARREARKRKKTKTKRKRGCGDEDDTEGGECELDAEAVEDAKRRRRLALFESNIQTKSNNN